MGMTSWWHLCHPCPHMLFPWWLLEGWGQWSQYCYTNHTRVPAGGLHVTYMSSLISPKSPEK